MGRLFQVTLEGKIYSCKHCKTHLALCDDIVSKAFHCKHGKAYLFSKVVNVTIGVKEDRLMMTGLHTEFAHDKLQKYKEGKSVLER
nr:protein yippee-like [Tanacetum cinerariifolium]